MNAGIKGDNLYSLISENNDFRNSVPLAQADEIKELFRSFTGDIAIGVVNVTMMSKPTFLAYAEVNNNDALEAIYKNKALLGLTPDESLIEVNKSEYLFKSADENIFFGVRNKQFYATNDELLYKGLFKTVDNSVEKAPYASELKGNNLFMAINTESILNLPAVKLLIGFGGEEAKMYANLASKISFISLRSEGESAVLSLNLTDKNTNSLKQIIDFAKLFVGI